MIELDTKGFQEMIDTLDNMGKDGDNIFKKALNEGISIVQKAIQRRAPVYEGKPKKGVVPRLLKENILIGKVRKSARGVYSQVCGPTKGDISRVYYGEFFEHGWKPHGDGKTTKLSSVEYGTSENHAQPFIRPGFDESKESAYTKLESIIMNGIEESFKK